MRVDEVMKENDPNSSDEENDEDLNLAAIAGQTPRNEGEGPSAYARRLHAAHPGLTIKELSLLSGAREGTLKADPAFKALSAALAATAGPMTRSASGGMG